MNPTSNAVIATLLSHRSTRAFTTDPVPDSDIEQAVRAGQAASTSSAVQAYSVIRVTDQATRAEIARLAGPQAYVETAPAFFVVCGDSRRHRLAAGRSNRRYEGRLEAFLVAVIDAALFAQNMAVALESMGYGMCYIGGIRNDLDRVDALLQLPLGVYPFFGMCVGRPAQSPAERPRLPVDAVLMRDRYDDDETTLSHIAAYDEIYRTYLAERGARPEQVELAWSGRVASLLAEPRRIADAAFYERKGARLD